MRSSSIGICSIVFFCMIFIVSCSSEDKTLKISPSKLDFKEVNLGDTSDIEITLTNKYGKDLEISSFVINGSNNFTITAGGSTPVNMLKGAEYKLTLTFEPTSAGTIEGSIVITHDASTKPKEVAITGVGVPVARIALSGSTFDFDKKLINKTSTHDFNIENIGTADLEISALTFTGLGATVYSISAGGPVPINITPGSSKTITIAFEPIVVGNYAADLEIEHNAVNEASPSIFSVLGEAIDVDPQITLSQSSPWDFGAVATTMPSMQFCEIENTGIDPLTVTSATLTTGAEFKIESLRDSNYNVINFPQIIAVGAKIYLWFKFSPTAKTTYNDTLTFVHDGTNEVTPWDISLTGEGRDEITKTFSYTGAKEQFQLPAGVITIKVEAYGAVGGDGYPLGTGYDGGKGGLVTASFSVTPGIILNIYVGGKGGNGTSTVDGAGGWNGGGIGNFMSSSNCGAGGGGASDIRIGGTDLTDRIIVAGAGGGSGRSGNAVEDGGAGGGLTGGNGYIISTFLDAYCGMGGTQTAGGAAATYGGQAGSLGKGGDADNTYPGGGGGAGYFGGGGGYYGGGGGGSSFTHTGANNVTHQQGVRDDAGEIEITY